MLHFVYELIDPRTDLPGYVGISNNPNARYKQHMEDKDTNPRKIAWIKMLKLLDIEPQMKILETVDSEKQAREREKYWIQYYLSQQILLTNVQENDISNLIRFGNEYFVEELEARWAVFFKLLNLSYVYRGYGYNIEGVWHVPSFWIPSLQCFIEICLERTPTHEITQKARQLAQHSGNNVYIISNGIRIGDFNTGEGCHYIQMEYPFTIHYKYRNIKTDQWEFIEPSITKEERIILQKLDDIDLRLKSNGTELLIVNDDNVV